MKVQGVILSVLILAGMVVPGCVAGESRTPVVVELFTSEGCSSCPPADALLGKLSQPGMVKGAEVFVLGEHVDYWNHLGWTDRFSSSAFTERQNGYAKRFHLDSPYTPQMVIDGHFETVGSEAASVQREIQLAAQNAKPASITLAWTGKNALHVTVEGAGDQASAVLLAVTEDGLVTKVAKGENGGRVLRHSGVVRELRQLGKTSHGTFAGTATVSPAATWKPRDLRIIVFVQRPGNGDIVGAAAANFPSALSYLKARDIQ
jgi:hypothetical protein